MKKKVFTTLNGSVILLECVKSVSEIFQHRYGLSSETCSAYKIYYLLGGTPDIVHVRQYIEGFRYWTDEELNQNRDDLIYALDPTIDIKKSAIKGFVDDLLDMHKLVKNMTGTPEVVRQYLLQEITKRLNQFIEESNKKN